MKAHSRGYESPAVILGDNDRTMVAVVYTHKEPGDQIKMAQLFALAPDLLAALKECLPYLFGDPNDPSGPIYKAASVIIKAGG